jgi:hypothetical protein
VDGVEHHDVSLAMQEMLNWHRGFRAPVGGRVPLTLDCLLMMSGLRSYGAFHNSRFDVGDESTLFTGWLTAIDYVYGPRCGGVIEYSGPGWPAEQVWPVKILAPNGLPYPKAVYNKDGQLVSGSQLGCSVVTYGPQEEE